MRKVSGEIEEIRGLPRQSCFKNKRGHGGEREALHDERTSWRCDLWQTAFGPVMFGIGALLICLAGVRLASKCREEPKHLAEQSER